MIESNFIQNSDFLFIYTYTVTHLSSNMLNILYVIPITVFEKIDFKYFNII